MNKLFKKEAILALIEIVCGIICVILGKDLIQYMVVFFGCGLIAYALVLLFNTKIDKIKIEAIGMMAIGIVLIIASFVFTTILLYMFAIIFLLYGITNLVLLIKQKVKFSTMYIRPILQIVIGVLLIIAQASTVNFMMDIVGIVLILEGLFTFIAIIKISK